jgi:DNA-directed RNA polymerase subunit K/omega
MYSTVIGNFRDDQEEESEISSPIVSRKQSENHKSKQNTKEEKKQPVYQNYNEQPVYPAKYSDSDNSEDEGMEDYKVGGYHPVHVGEVYLHRYLIMQKLGWGHFSTVWLAKDLKYSTFVAIKIQKSAQHYLEAAYDEVEILSRVIRDENGNIMDSLHKTLPFITKYEKARILGERAKQIDAGALPLVEVDPSIIDGYLIALKEFDAKVIPFIIQRPLPSGACEYWKFSDLEILA